ncbi:hypothetical protein ACQF36_39880 [Streptomyces sp. Marseille-Q5077]|uniref:hypothetical protein n=1 Tax=Streptomyces sp. Marseille-Q5077 TaxID=3418995 RepID=UPI003CFCB700
MRARRLLEAADKKNDTAAAAQLLTLAVDQPGSYELYLDVVTRMKVTTAKKALLDNPAQAARVPGLPVAPVYGRVRRPTRAGGISGPWNASPGGSPRSAVGRPCS